MTTETQSKSATIAPATRSAAKPATKKAKLIALLERKSGATVAAASETFGWQYHTTRAALTGLRKAGYEIDLIKPENGGAGTYRIMKQHAEAAE